MQLSKASKKTRTIADETTAPAPETSASAEVKSSTRTPRSSKTKKEPVLESAGSAKNHRKLSTPAHTETVRPAVEPMVAKTRAAAAAALEYDSSALTHRTGEVSNEEIARLAHAYWVARGYAHGSSVEDWLRAERELKAEKR